MKWSQLVLEWCALFGIFGDCVTLEFLGFGRLLTEDVRYFPDLFSSGSTVLFPQGRECGQSEYSNYFYVGDIDLDIGALTGQKSDFDGILQLWMDLSLC